MPIRSRVAEPQSVEYMSSTDARFLDTLEVWLRASPEILVLIRYSCAAGAKSFEFFDSFNALAQRINQLPPHTSVIAFRQPQLPLRGIVDGEFISRCLGTIRDGIEFLIVEKGRQRDEASWVYEAGESHSELREALEGSSGRAVAVGEYPPWLETSSDVISAVVPDANGITKPGIY
jgi:hypothetical protein